MFKNLASKLKNMIPAVKPAADSYTGFGPEPEPAKAEEVAKAAPTRKKRSVIEDAPQQPSAFMSGTPPGLIAGADQLNGFMQARPQPRPDEPGLLNKQLYRADRARG